MSEISAEKRSQISLQIEESSAFDAPYIIMNVLATIVACYGLFADSPAVVIGAMIVALLLGPITGSALALVSADLFLLRKASVAVVGGVVVVLVTAFILGTVHADLPVTHEMTSRTSPTFLDLMIALAAGGAGAYATISPRLSVAFVGVAIARALFRRSRPVAYSWREAITRWRAEPFCSRLRISSPSNSPLRS